MYDHRKDSSSTLQRIARGIKQIWKDSIGAPNSEKTIQDMYLTFKAHKAVYDVEGKMAP